MDTTKAELHWWSIGSIRISHPTLNPDELTEQLSAVPSIAQQPGESRVPYGNCKSAGFWCMDHRAEHPDRPDAILLWAEQFVLDREPYFRCMVESDYYIDLYIGVFSNVMALGFNVPETPTMRRLGIPIGIEFFSS